MINTESPAYKAGKDCGLNGPNETNCHFSFFSEQHHTDDWTAGKKEGENMKHIRLTLQAYAEIKTSTVQAGTIQCPKCNKALHYSKAGNGHIRMKCSTDGCLQAME